jgi:hypothetical protein
MFIVSYAYDQSNGLLRRGQSESRCRGIGHKGNIVLEYEGQIDTPGY